MHTKRKQNTSARSATLLNIPFIILLFALGFGVGYQANKPVDRVKIEDQHIIACFSPQGGCERHIVEALEKALHRVDIMAYSFTSSTIAHAVIRAKNRGVKVRLICDLSQMRHKRAKVSTLQQQGVKVRIARHAGLMHNKVIIIDLKTVITGSYNFTVSAERYNAENILLVYNKQIVQRYFHTFEKIWNEASLV